MIFISDIHLGISGTDKVRDIMMHDIKIRLKEVLSASLKDDKTIFVLGDIFNRINPSIRMINIFFEWLAQCRRRNVEVHIIGGNHDSGFDWLNTSLLSSLELDGITVYEDVTEVEINGKRILIIPHLPVGKIKVLENNGIILDDFLWRNRSQIDIIVGHGLYDFSDLLGYENELFFEAGKAMVIAPKIDFKLMILGHIHNKTEIKLKNDSVVLYPGSLIINNFGELDEVKTYIQVDMSSLDYELVPYKSKVTDWIRVNLDLLDKSERDIDWEKVKEVCSNSLVKVVVYKREKSSVDENFIRKEIGSVGTIVKFETEIEGTSNVRVSLKINESDEDLLKKYLTDNAKDLGLTKKMVASICAEGNKIIELMRGK